MLTLAFAVLSNPADITIYTRHAVVTKTGTPSLHLAQNLPKLL
jgi:hypothetical protein